MNYNDFKDILIEEVSQKIDKPNKCFYKEVLKNNGVVLDGLMLSNDENTVSPTVYVNDFYQSYLAGEEITQIVDAIVDIFNNNKLDDGFDVDKFCEFERIKGNIAYKIISVKLNEKLLESIPHRIHMDFAVCYYIVIRDRYLSNASILINNSHAKMWHVDEEKLYEIASINTPKLLEAEFTDMKEMLLDLTKERDDSKEEWIEEIDGEDCGMYVLTNTDRIFGAATILYKDVLRDFAKNNSSNLYILPSSIHEVIVLLERFADDKEYLNKMVCEVNATQVPRTDILSDHAYYYDFENDVMTAC